MGPSFNPFDLFFCPCVQLYTLDVLLSVMFSRHLGGSFSFMDFSIEHVLDFPQQVGCKDCGVFVLQMMRYVSARHECCKEVEILHNERLLLDVYYAILLF